MNNATYLLSKVMGFKEYSINDLKTLFITEKYATETLKLYDENADTILIDEAINQISGLQDLQGCGLMNVAKVLITTFDYINFSLCF